MNKTSKSEQLYRLLAERASQLGDGARFPTLREIMSEYRVSQFTAAPALKRMQRNGLIASHVGRGSFVIRGATPKKGARILYLRPDWPSHSIEAMERGMTGEALSRGYCCEVVRYPVDADIYRLLPDFEADAVILDPIRFDSFTAEQLQILTSSVRPVVLCRSTLPVFNIKCVGSHLMETGMTAANYLYRKGHRRIAVIHDPDYTGCGRAEGIRIAIREGGFEQDGFLLALSSSEPLHLSVKRLIDNGCTAVWVPGEDMRALEVNWLLQELSGKRVPEDISLLGSENPGISEFQRPSLSTISIPLHDMAEIAVDLVMEGECNILRKVEIPAKLIERNSVMSLK